MFNIKWLDGLFESAGIVVIGFIIMIIVDLAVSAICDWIRRVKYRHKVEHRFDKKPEAKCYCVDCQFWDSSENFCNRHHKYVNDAEFCSCAKPRVKEPGEREQCNE